MSLDLRQARANIKARILEVPAIRSVVTSKQKAGAPVEAMNEWGDVGIFAICHFGRPVPDFGRTIADSEKDYPHVWPVHIELVGPEGDDLQDVCDDLDDLMLAWQPDGPNSTGFSGGASFSYDAPTTERFPAHVELHRYYTCLVNMSKDV